MLKKMAKQPIKALLTTERMQAPTTSPSPATAAEVARRTRQLESYMQQHYHLRYNTMIDAPECKELGNEKLDYQPITKRLQNTIAFNARLSGINAWDRDIVRYIVSNHTANFSPIEAYLEKLPAWDGLDRIRPLMRRVASGNARWERYSYLWFLSMVAHWLGRDKQHGNALSPLIVGAQGCGKSTFCRNILPPELRSYFTDSIDFSRKRDAELYLTRFALINIDEFDQVSERYQGFLKHLQQKANVNVRRAYSSMVEEQKRYASFIATSNHTDLLSDTSGSRRFICVETKSVIDNAQPICYEQLYAQALAALNSGERYWLTRSEEVTLMAENETFSRRSIAQELFFRFFRPAIGEDEGRKISAGEIYLALQTKGKVKLAPTQLSNFGRFLKKVCPQRFVSNHGVLYRVVEQE